MAKYEANLTENELKEAVYRAMKTLHVMSRQLGEAIECIELLTKLEKRNRIRVENLEKQLQRRAQ